ncbi:MAG: ComF family protein [Chitinophagaceae bacterium]|nr:MAG: ComF family protein [Chitinophagaceae bacterium]
MVSIKHLFADAMQLFFPHFCVGCGSNVLANSDQLCLRCMSMLPYTGYEAMANNPIEKIFRGRVNIEQASSTFYFSKGHLVQQLIHELKYKGNQPIGHQLGSMMGTAVLQSGRFTNIDYLVPLPLYADKEFKRGYNQSTIICNGMSSSLQVPVMTNNVLRQRYTDTQTKKHRAERWENVAGSFAISNPSLLSGRHVLLVDDVITTGATLEACTECLLKVPGLRVSLATLATASK